MLGSVIGQTFKIAEGMKHDKDAAKAAKADQQRPDVDLNDVAIDAGHVIQTQASQGFFLSLCNASLSLETRSRDNANRHRRGFIPLRFRFGICVGQDLS